MARPYRRRIRRGRFRKRYRKFHKRYRRFRRKQSIHKRATRFIKKSLRQYKRTPYASIRTPYENGRQVKNFQQLNVVKVTLSQLNSGTGKYFQSFTVGSIMDQDDFNAIDNQFIDWRMEAFSCNLKIIEYGNFYKATASTTPLTSYLWKDNGPNNMDSMCYLGLFKNSTQQPLIQSALLDPDVADSLRKILETGCYKRAVPGRGVSFSWMNSAGYKGIYNGIGSATYNSLLSTAFLGSYPVEHFPFSWGLMLLDRSHIQGSTGTDEMSIKVQIITNCTISYCTKIPV